MINKGKTTNYLISRTVLMLLNTHIHIAFLKHYLF
jgi:hypothetical protein